MSSITLSELQTAHPSGQYYPDHGCFYFVDYDEDLGYFIEYQNGNFEAEPNWVDIDTLSDDEADDCVRIHNRILCAS